MISSVSTAEELARLPPDENRYELVRGAVHRTSPARGRRGRVAGRTRKLLAPYEDAQDLGATFAAETGWLLARDPDAVPAPDAAFVAATKRSTLAEDSGFWPFASDRAVEVVSPRGTFADVESKAFCWLASGARRALIAEPASQTVHVCRSQTKRAVRNSADTIDAGDVVPGGNVRAADFFPGREPQWPSPTPQSSGGRCGATAAPADPRAAAHRLGRARPGP